MEKDVNFREVEQFVRERAGYRLPGEREMAAQFGVSRPRLRAILATLAEEGLVTRYQGAGTWAQEERKDELGRVVLLVDENLKLGDDPFFSRFVELVQAELQSIRATCLIHRPGADEINLPRCDGVVLLGRDSVARWQRQTVPPVSAVGVFSALDARPTAHLSLIELDDFDAGVQAANKLVQSGCQRFYFFGWPQLPAVRERLRGIESVVNTGSVSLQIVECGMNFAAGLVIASRWQVPVGDQIGLIAANDWLALGLHAGWQNHDAQWRRTTHLVSFDGLSSVLGAAARPEIGLQSLAVPLETIAADAVAEVKRLHLAQRQGNAVGRRVRYTLEWI